MTYMLLVLAALYSLTTSPAGHVYRYGKRRLPSVTGILKILAKPALIDWAANITIEYANRFWDELTPLAAYERGERMRAARFDRTKEAADTGKRIHTFAEQLGKTDEADPPPELAPRVEQVARFLDEWQMETVHAEAAVVSLKYWYAGAFDTIVDSPKLGRCLIDWKTGRGIYAEHALQVAAYRFAELLFTRQSTTDPWVEQPMPPVDATFVAHIGVDSVRLLPVRAEQSEFDAFLYARELYEWNEAATNATGESFDPPIGEALYPEQVTV